MDSVDFSVFISTLRQAQGKLKERSNNQAKERSSHIYSNVLTVM